MPHCNICQKDSQAEPERASIRSNVRKFREERFEVWRCPGCLSIHASNEVDLGHYYSYYPFHDLRRIRVDWMLRVMYRSLLRRLRRAGLDRSHEILDYGCGSGALVNFLRSEGYRNTSGFDEYSDEYKDRRTLGRSYDFIVSQDVIEHVADPWEFLREIAGICKPGAVIVIGTPNAEAIDLKRAEDYVHTLHQPYHRHILSKTALLGAGDGLGWTLMRYYPTMYTNTPVPFVNQNFVIHYFRCFDNTVDLALEPIRVNSWRVWSPETLFIALFGSLWAPQTDVMAVFKAGAVQ